MFPHPCHFDRSEVVRPSGVEKSPSLYRNTTDEISRLCSCLGAVASLEMTEWESRHFDHGQSPGQASGEICRTVCMPQTDPSLHPSPSHIPRLGMTKGRVLISTRAKPVWPLLSHRPDRKEYSRHSFFHPSLNGYLRGKKSLDGQGKRA